MFMNVKKRKNYAMLLSQASLEFLIIVGMGMLILLPIIYLSIEYKTDISDIRSAIMIKDTLKEIKINSMSVYNQGTNSKKTIYIILPSNMEYFGIENNRFIVIRARMSYGEEDFFIDLPFNISFSSLPNTYGRYKLIITSLEDGVKYDFVKLS